MSSNLIARSKSDHVTQMVITKAVPRAAFCVLKARCTIAPLTKAALRSLIWKGATRIMRHMRILDARLR